MEDIGLIFEKKCPCCGSMLYRKRPCKGLKYDGWKWMLKCPRAGCGYMEGLDKEDNE